MFNAINAGEPVGGERHSGFLVVDKRSNTRSFWVSLLRYKHCFLIIDCHLGQRLINPRSDHILNTRVYFVDLKFLRTQYPNAKIFAYAYLSKSDGSKPNKMNCVEVCKYFMGIDKKWVKTPWVLYLYIAFLTRFGPNLLSGDVQ